MTTTTPAGGIRRFGNTDLQVSRLGYGAMELAGPPLGRDIAESDAVHFINGIVDSGITYIDTSIDYGRSERLIGKALAHRRGDFYLASKCACAVGVKGHGDKHEKHTYTGENVIAGIEQSLVRLQTDYLDVVQVHGDPTRKQLEGGGVIEALQKMKADGKVRCIGISSRLPKLADFVNADYFDLVQVPYSPLQRQNEDVIAALKQSGKAIVARGVTGRGAPAKNWETRPIGTVQGYVQELWERAGLDDLLDGMSRLEFMIRFVLANDNIDVALVATTNRDHLLEDVALASKGPLDPVIVQAACDRLDAAGGGAGQGEYARGGPTPVA